LPDKPVPVAGDGSRAGEATTRPSQEAGVIVDNRGACRSDEPAMRHRHIEVAAGQWSVAVVDSILERGGASDVIALLAELRRDPNGAAARAAEASARHSEVYGYPELILACLEAWRHVR
jgi:hypothetical protein